MSFVIPRNGDQGRAIRAQKVNRAVGRNDNQLTLGIDVPPPACTGNGLSQRGSKQKSDLAVGKIYAVNAVWKGQESLGIALPARGLITELARKGFPWLLAGRRETV